MTFCKGNIVVAEEKHSSVLPSHAQLAGEWDLPHRDPFDRMLAAQAKLEGITLATVDKALSGFPIEITNR